MNKYIVLDTETGGLRPKTASLLTAYFAVMSQSGELLGELDLVLKPEADTPFLLSAGAMAVNKIDIAEHSKKAVSYLEGSRLLLEFLQQFAGPKNQLTPVGHNIEFDLGFIYEYLMRQEGWEHFVSYRKLDTAAVAGFCKYSGKIPPKQSLSLGVLAKHLGIQVNDSNLHSAKEDAQLTWQVLQSLQKL